MINDLKVGDQLKFEDVPGAGVGTVESIVDGQLLIRFDDGQRLAMFQEDINASLMTARALCAARKLWDEPE